jgi:hypothetical protein
LLPATKNEEETFVLHRLLPYSSTFIKGRAKRNLGNAGFAPHYKIHFTISKLQETVKIYATWILMICAPCQILSS